MSVTKLQLANKFAEFCGIMGLEIGFKNGQFMLEQVQYFGMQIFQYGENGTESHPFGYSRRGASEMFRTLDLAIQAMEYQKKMINLLISSNCKFMGQI